MSAHTHSHVIQSGAWLFNHWSQHTYHYRTHTHTHLCLIASSFSGSSTTTDTPRCILDFCRLKSKHAIFALLTSFGMAERREHNMFEHLQGIRHSSSNYLTQSQYTLSLSIGIPIVTLRGNSAVQSIAIDQNTFLCTSTMSFENIDRVDWIFSLSFGVGSLNSHGCIHHHVGKEVRLTVCMCAGMLIHDTLSQKCMLM